MQESFTTTINKSIDVSLYGFNSEVLKVDLDIDTTQVAVIDWTFEVESRTWGIKDISVYITKVSCEIEWEIDSEYLTENDKVDLIAAGGAEYRKQYGETFEGVHTIDTSIDDTWEIVSEVEIGSTICPEDVEIDFKTRKITIS